MPNYHVKMMMITLMKLCSLWQKCQTKAQYSTYTFCIILLGVYFKMKPAKTNSCQKSLPVYEQSASNIYQVVGLPLERRKKKSPVFGYKKSYAKW